MLKVYTDSWRLCKLTVGNSTEGNHRQTPHSSLKRAVDWESRRSQYHTGLACFAFPYAFTHGSPF